MASSGTAGSAAADSAAKERGDRGGGVGGGVGGGGGRSTLRFVLLTVDNVSDFRLGMAIGSLQTILDAIAALAAGLRALRVEDPVPGEGRIVITAELATAAIPDAVQAVLDAVPWARLVHEARADLRVGLDFESLAGAESTVRVMQALSAKLDLSLATSLAGLDALKQVLRSKESLSASTSFPAQMLPGLLAWPDGAVAWAKMVGVADVELAFETVDELLEVLAPKFLGDRRKDLLAFARLVEGRHIATFLTLPMRTGLVKEMPTVVEKLYTMLRSTFKGVASVETRLLVRGGLEALCLRLECENVNPFTVLPAMSFDDFQSSKYDRAEMKEGWMKHFR
jgi:hypothetical protein